MREILTNEKYIGNNVYNRRSFKLKKKRVVNTPEMWVRREGAFDPIISPEDFYTAQGIILARARRLAAWRLVEERRSRGKALHPGVRSGTNGAVSSEQILKAYREETNRQKAIVQKATLCETRLVFAVSALKQLFQDGNFTTLLRAESLDNLPQYLAAQINGEAC